MNKFKQLLAFVIIILFSANLYAGASDEVSTSSDDFETFQTLELSPRRLRSPRISKESL